MKTSTAPVSTVAKELMCKVMFEKRMQKLSSLTNAQPCLFISGKKGGKGEADAEDISVQMKPEDPEQGESKQAKEEDGGLFLFFSPKFFR